MPPGQIPLAVGCVVMNVETALNVARGIGLDKPGAKARVESVAKQWDAGWRPGIKRIVPVDEARYELARQYAREGNSKRAAYHFRHLLNSDNRSLVRRARQRLRGLERSGS